MSESFLNQGGQGAGQNGQQGAGQGAGGNQGGQGGGGNTNPWPATDWRHTLPEDLRADDNIKPMNDVPALVKSFINAQKLIGADKIALPGKHATEDDWQPVYDKLGRPSLDKYEPALPKDAKFLDPEWIKELKPLAHKAGIMPAQLEKVLTFYESKQAAIAKTQSEQAVAQTKANIEGLKTEWGQAHEQKAAYARKVFKEFVGEEGQKWLNESGVGNNPHLIKAFAALGEKLFKEDVIAGTGQGQGNLLSPSEAEKKYNDIVSNMEHPYNKPDHPNHKFAVKEVTDLFAMRYPNPQ